MLGLVCLPAAPSAPSVWLWQTGSGLSGAEGGGSEQAGEKLLLLLFSFSPASPAGAPGAQFKHGAQAQPCMYTEEGDADPCWPSWGSGWSGVYSCTYACTTYDEGHGAREAREETGQTGGEARDRPAGGATRRVTSLRLRAPRRAAPLVRVAPVRCLAGSAP